MNVRLFPRRLFFQFLFWQALVTASLLFSFWLWSVPEARPSWGVLVGLVIAGVALSAIANGKLLSPLSNLLSRARGLPVEDDDLSVEDPGEWSELEREMRRISDQLKREREIKTKEDVELNAV